MLCILPVMKNSYHKFHILLLVLLLLTYDSQAQFNDTTHYHINYQGTGSINRTNLSKSYLLNNNLTFGIKEKTHSLNFNNSWVYGRQSTGTTNSLTNNDVSSGLDFNLYKTFPHFFYWGLVNYNSSYSLKINSQLLTGVGVAYSVIDKKNSWLNISDGIVYDQSDIYLVDSTRDIYHTFRNSLRLSFHWNYRDMLILDGANFYQNSIKDGSDYIIRTTTSLSFKIKKWLSITSSLVYNKQSRTQSENLLFTYGLTLDKYW